MTITEIILSGVVIFLLLENYRAKKALRVLDWKTKDLLQKTKGKK